MYFDKLMRESKYEDKECRSKLPYWRLHGTVGTKPSPKLEKEIQYQVNAMDRAMSHALDDTRLGLAAIANEPPVMPGIGVRPSMLQEYLKDRVVIASDKNGTTVVNSVKKYRHGLMQHMRTLKDGEPVYECIDARPDRE